MLSVVALVVASFNAFSQAVDCDGSHIAAMACQSKRLKDLDAELNRVYQLALAAMPEKDDQDIRRSREQLRKSQRAWLAFLHENCALEGGLQGGTNSWVSTFAGDCAEKELTARITFLKSVATGTFGNH
jgi:uncharacterized protein YecT (DUF1311 family)